MESDHANNLNNHINEAFNLRGSNIADDNDLQQNVPANINDIANEDLNEVSVDNELYPREGLALRLAPDGSIIVNFSSTIEVGDIYSSSDDEWATASISMVPPEGGSREISTGESAISGEISIRMVSPSILSANVGGQEEHRYPLGENNDPLGVQDSFLAQEAPLVPLDLNPYYEIGGSTRTLAPNPLEDHQHGSLAPLQYSDIPDSLSQIQSLLHPSIDNGSPSLPESRSFLNTLQSPTSTLVGGPSIRWRPLLTPQQANYQESGSSNSNSTRIGVDTGNTDLLATQPPLVSLSSAVPMSTAEFSEFSMTYIRERYEQERRNEMTDEEAHYFFNDNINENAGGGGEQSVAEVAVGEEVADPTRERLVELVNQYIRMFRALQLQTPSYDPIMRAQLASEDMLSIHTPMSTRIPEEAPDAHATLRFNVDDMSYEQLMELEESIGSVSTGLTEALISRHVTRRKFKPPAIVLPDELEKELCCICQDEYDEGADVARLACGHEYHFNCIQQWLFRKNDCPICKRKAIKL